MTRKKEMRPSRVSRSDKKDRRPHHTILVFPSDLGWMAAIVAGQTLRQLTFGHASAKAARAALDPGLASHARAPGDRRGWNAACKHYASGKADDFRDVPVNAGPMSDFQRRVRTRVVAFPMAAPSATPRLAAQAGFPSAARAAGNCMAGNCVPLVVPCHRVIAPIVGLDHTRRRVARP